MKSELAIRYSVLEKYNFEKIADDYAIEFAEWCDDLGYVKFPNLWICLEDESGKTSKELLEIYKKEKGL
jgi:hypothetical protein